MRARHPHAAHTTALPACASKPYSAGSPKSLQVVYTPRQYACKAHLIQWGTQCLQPACIQVMAAMQLEAVRGAPHLVPHWRHVRERATCGLRDIISPPVPGRTAGCCINVTCSGRENVVRAIVKHASLALRRRKGRKLRSQAPCNRGAQYHSVVVYKVKG